MTGLEVAERLTRQITEHIRRVEALDFSPENAGFVFDDAHPGEYVGDYLLSWDEAKIVAMVLQEYYSAKSAAVPRTGPA